MAKPFSIWHVTAHNEKNREDVQELQGLPEESPGNLDVVVNVGSAVTEEVLIVGDDFKIGQKHMVVRHELFGGTGFNCAFRLIEGGIPVLPILLVGRDRAGQAIQEQLALLSRDNAGNKLLREFIEEQGFLFRGLQTLRTCVVVTKTERTIFTERLRGAKRAKEFVLGRAARIFDKPELHVRALLIGHIHADNPIINQADPGGVTKSLINLFRRKCKIFLNLGNSQLALGSSFWEDYLDDVTFFQLSLGEMRRFLKTNHSEACLPEIIEWLGSKCRAGVITLGALGAVATWEGAIDRVIFVRPHEVGHAVDSTGAGDAFAAGVVSVLYRRETIGLDDLIKALSVATNWAASACTSVGAATTGRNRISLKGIRSDLTQNGFDPVEILSFSSAVPLLERLDKAY